MTNVIKLYARLLGVSIAALILGLYYPVPYMAVKEFWNMFQTGKLEKLREQAHKANNPNLLGKFADLTNWHPLRAKIYPVGMTSSRTGEHPPAVTIVPTPGASDFGVQSYASVEGTWRLAFSVVVDSDLKDYLTLSIARSNFLASATYDLSGDNPPETTHQEWRVLESYIEPYGKTSRRVVIAAEGASKDLVYLQIKMRRRSHDNIDRHLQIVKLEIGRFASGDPSKQ